ncbi:Gustatory receptor 111 [Hyalella azteca]|uniref:Gustatory receptor 111 n=1 Tax=Hyalella azteca TaxID=294128 RepID=A0A6A0GX23_HYAAZ|nr:Gustatory receptor 111 [Hyalella azteca]
MDDLAGQRNTIDRTTPQSRAMPSKNKSLQRCFMSLKIMGFYLEWNTVTDSSELQDRSTPASENVIDHSEHKNLTIKNNESRWIQRREQTRPSNLKNLCKLAWCFIMNALYITRCIYFFSDHDYTNNTMDGIFKTIWSIIGPTMVVLSAVKCIFSRRTFYKLRQVIECILNSEEPHARRPNKFSSNSWLLLCLAITRIAKTCVVVKRIIVRRNLGIKYAVMKINSYLGFLFLFMVALVLIFSFNYFVGVLKRRFEEISEELSEYGTQLSELHTETAEYPSSLILTTATPATEDSVRPLVTPDKFLKDTEHRLLLIDQAIALINDVYSWILIFMSIWYLSDFLFSIYTMIIKIESGNHEIETYSVVAIEALLFLFLIHNPADALANAEEDFILNVRQLIYRAPELRLSKAYTGLVMAIQRPRTLTLGNFGNVGRSSFLNTLAFMFSYLVVVIQFHIDAKHPASTTSPANASCVIQN